MKLHQIIISVGFIGFIFIGFMLFYADGVTHYTVSGMDQSQLKNINRSLDQMNQDAESTSSALNAVQGLPLGLNVLGGFIVNAFGALKTTKNSFDLMKDIALDSGNYLPFGGLFRPFIIFIGASLLIILTIAIFMKFLSPSDTL
jgi:hypothetical protein